jgi:hypothetical protein
MAQQYIQADPSIQEGQRKQEEFQKDRLAAGNGTRQHPPKLRTIDEERNEAAREHAAVESSFSHEMKGQCVPGMKPGSFDSGETVLIQFPFSTKPTRIAARNWPGAEACGAKRVAEPVHMKETVNGHVAPSPTPRIHVL